MSSRYATGQVNRFDAPQPQAQRYCTTPGCKTYIGKGRYADSFADVIVPSDGIQLCALCYMKGLYAAGKGQLSLITGRDWQVTPEMVKAHWARLDAAEAEKEARRARV